MKVRREINNDEYDLGGKPQLTPDDEKSMPKKVEVNMARFAESTNLIDRHETMVSLSMVNPLDPSSSQSSAA